MFIDEGKLKLADLDIQKWLLSTGGSLTPVEIFLQSMDKTCIPSPYTSTCTSWTFSIKWTTHAAESQNLHAWAITYIDGVFIIFFPNHWKSNCCNSLRPNTPFSLFSLNCCTNNVFINSIQLLPYNFKKILESCITRDLQTTRYWRSRYINTDKNLHTLFIMYINQKSCIASSAPKIICSMTVCTKAVSCIIIVTQIE